MVYNLDLSEYIYAKISTIALTSRYLKDFYLLNLFYTGCILNKFDFKKIEQK